MTRPLKDLEPATYTQHVGAAIRRRRLRKKLSVEAAAEAAGIPAPTWYAVEAGRSLTLDRLPAIAAALGCKTATLLPEQRR